MENKLEREMTSKLKSEEKKQKKNFHLKGKP